MVRKRRGTGRIGSYQTIKNRVTAGLRKIELEFDIEIWIGLEIEAETEP